MDPGVFLAEFLDTFSLLAHVRGGCQGGMVAFSDFLAYYDLVSSTIENDSYFDLLMHRLWPIPDGDMEERNEQAASKRWAAPVYDPSANPTARGRPPAHHGPTAYSKPVAEEEENSRVQETHRRFSRSAQSVQEGREQTSRLPAYSAI